MTQASNIVPLATTAGAQGYRFRKAGFANLVRDKFSRVYFCRAKILGVSVVRSLETKSLQIAKVKLDALLESERERILNLRQGQKSVGTFKALAAVWFAEVDADRDLKPRAKEYRAETLALLQRTWPDLNELAPHRITEAKCKDWAARFAGLKSARGKPFSPTRFNGCVETLRAVLEHGMNLGLLAGNPALKVERARVLPRAIVLPSPKDFRAVLKRLDALPARSRSALMVRFLAFGGPRVSAARGVYPQDVDLKANTIRLPPIKYQERPLVVPMLPDMRRVVKQLLAEHPGGNLPLLPIKNPRRALRSVCKELGLPPLTAHDLRHLFTTHCLESGMSVAEVAALRGDKDGGAMLLKTYSHIRNEHLHRAVGRVRF